MQYRGVIYRVHITDTGVVWQHADVRQTGAGVGAIGTVMAHTTKVITRVEGRLIALADV